MQERRGGVSKADTANGEPDDWVRLGCVGTNQRLQDWCVELAA